MTTTPPGGTPPQIAFAAHGALVRAIDTAAGERGDSRSSYIRKIIANHLRDEGHLAPEAPVTRQSALRIARASHV